MKDVVAVKAVLLALLTPMMMACSDPGMPPPIQDSDGGIVINTDGSTTTDPCSGEPAPGCACDDAGAQFYCGVVYRVSGKHVDCSPGYLTCKGNGKWSDCIGAQVYDGK